MWLAQYSETTKINRVLVGGLSLVMVTFIGFLVSLTISGQVDERSAKGLVADYEAHRTNNNEALIFFVKRPFSASFYTQGKAEEITDATQLGQRLNGQSNFVVIHKQSLRNLPVEIKQQLKPVAHHAEYELMFVEAHP
jgi:hypothetical protein